MCGIIGLIDPNQKVRYDISDLNQMQNHRGPDERGVYKKSIEGLSMAMTRLSIVAVKEAHQPYISKDGYVVIFNGEIFNCASLFKEIDKLQSDKLNGHEVEVIYFLYKKYGESFLHKLNGMFSLSIYDPKQNSIFIARDRFGIKPLHYYNKDGVFCFSSEIRPLKKSLNGNVSIDSQSVANYFRLGYVPNPNTIYSEIKHLPPGNYIKYSLADKKLEMKKWWKHQYTINNELSKNDWYESINSQLSKSLTLWTTSDVPIAFSLSGGLDSSSLVALASVNSNQRIKTYSLGFEGEREEAWNELKIARDVSRKYNTDHTEIILKPDNLLDRLEDMVLHLEQPYAGGLPSWPLFQKIAKEYKVAIIGSGGDEIFGNYNRGRFFSQLNKGGLVKNLNLDLFKDSIQNAFFLMKEQQANQILKNNEPSIANDLSHLFNEYKHNNVDDSVAQLSIDSQLVDEFLMMTDRFSMANSLEVRTPYLDHDLVSLLFSMPIEYRLDRDIYKIALRKSIGHLLPKSVLSAKKNGFKIPLSLWMRGHLRALVEELVGQTALNNSEFIKPDFYRNYVKPMLDGDNSNISLIWSVLMFQLWLSGANKLH
jgi:asparagine synthase (glutamine-hydrolysing)